MYLKGHILSQGHNLSQWHSNLEGIVYLNGTAYLNGMAYFKDTTSGRKNFVPRDEGQRVTLCEYENWFHSRCQWPIRWTEDVNKGCTNLDSYIGQSQYTLVSLTFTVVTFVMRNEPCDPTPSINLS